MSEPPPGAVPGYSPKEDVLKVLAVGLSLLVCTLVLNAGVVEEHSGAALLALFFLRYAGIIFEETLAFNKAGVALVMAALLWTVRAVASPAGAVGDGLQHSMAEVSQVLFFLLGAMTIVETVDAHQGFRVIASAIEVSASSTRKLMWLLAGVTFLMSSVLDNFTTTVVLVSLLRKLTPSDDQRRFLGAVVVLAANAGGAWTPIGDVTTTMLWIGGQITTLPTMRDLLLPSIASVAIPLALFSFFNEEAKGDSEVAPMEASAAGPAAMAPRADLVLGVGLAALLFAPLFNAATGLPPFLGMLAGLGALWMTTDVLHAGEPQRESFKVSSALERIDTESVLFFLGIIMSVAALDDAGLLRALAAWLDAHVPSQVVVAAALGFVSAVLDNVPGGVPGGHPRVLGAGGAFGTSSHGMFLNCHGIAGNDGRPKA